jgi:hypothetical protein
MTKRMGGDRVVHSYDVGSHQVRCGRAGQTSSTKHAAGVTCATCRELLDRAQGAHPPAEAPAAPGE